MSEDRHDNTKKNGPKHIGSEEIEPTGTPLAGWFSALRSNPNFGDEILVSGGEL